MAIKVQMPMLGLTMSEGTVTEWFKKEGEQAIKGEPLFAIMTDKANVEVESPEDSYLLKILAKQGQTVPVGALVAVMGHPAEDISQLLKETAASESQSVAFSQSFNQDGPTSATSLAENKAAQRILASPRAKMMAQEFSIDLAEIVGSGEAGRITEKDVLNVVQKKKANPSMANGAVIPFTGIRELIAKRLAQSQQERVHIHFSSKIDMSRAIEFRTKFEQGQVGMAPRKVSYNDLLIMICGKCLTEFPNFNASLDKNEIKLHPTVNIGLAVAVESGLVVPVIWDVTKKTLPDIADATKKLIEKARAGKLLPDEMSGGTFTISNLGMYGIDSFTAIINPPESAIMAVGAIHEEPVVVDHQIAIRPIMRITLAIDHRVLDGADAARFLKRFKELLENPMMLL